MTTKYQYIRQSYKDPKGLCITIATDLELADHKHSVCHWTVAFKNPKDQFSKKDAREAIENNQETIGYNGVLILNNDYTRNEIVCKILMQLCIHENILTSTYAKFVRYLVEDYCSYGHLTV